MDLTLTRFADEVGPDDPVVAVGGRTQWSVGGPPSMDAREVRAPAGLVEHEPAEMVVRCRAGTTVADLDSALAERGQTVALPAWEGATVGGVLAVGRSGLRRLRLGPVRDTLLEATFVSDRGELVKAGGPVVKNVSGFDVCRLLVGSLGTIGILAEVVLRVVPQVGASRWLCSRVADPFDVRRRLHRPSSILWDGTSTWVLLEGHEADVVAERAVLGPTFADVDGPPDPPQGGRRSVRPSELATLVPHIGDERGEFGEFVAEIGVGVVHTAEPVPPAAPAPSAMEVHRRIKELFDPRGRLNPGRSVIAA